MLASDNEDDTVPKITNMEDENSEEKKRAMQEISRQFMQHMKETHGKEAKQQQFYKQLSQILDEIQTSMVGVKDSVKYIPTIFAEFQEMKDENTRIRKILRSYERRYKMCIMMVCVCVMLCVLYKFFPMSAFMACNALKHYAFRPTVFEPEKTEYVDEIFETLFPDTTSSSESSISSQQTTVDSIKFLNPAKMISAFLSWTME